MTVLAGGTDVFPALGDRPAPAPMLDVTAIREIQGISATAEHWVIGARTTWSEVLSAPLPRGFDGLKAAAREVGSVQIQNAASVAGNLCNASPAADGVAALLALDAEVTLASKSGTRTLALGDFVLGNRKTALRVDELMVSVRVPRRVEQAHSVFLKLGARRYLVISIAMVAANLVIGADGAVQEALISVGSCSAKAVRLRELEASLRGKNVGDDLGGLVHSEDLDALSPIDDVRGTAEYRRDAARTLVGRALNECPKRALTR